MASQGLIDSHVHMQDPMFQSDLTQTLVRAEQAGVRYMLCNGTREADWPAVRNLAKTCRRIIPCFGLHPWFVRERSEHWLRNLEEFLQAVPSAVGEIGLDRWIDDRDEPAQEQVFRSQWALAVKYRRPVMVHCLRAWGWLLDVMRTVEPLPAGMLLHAYGGSSELISPLAERGAYFSFAGSALAGKALRARDAIRNVPADRLMIETDAPFMPPPEPYRCPDLRTVDGHLRNEPACLPAVLRGAAELLDKSEADLRRILWTNGLQFLKNLMDDRGKWT
jgi:TatD DNase family protein